VSLTLYLGHRAKAAAASQGLDRRRRFYRTAELVDEI